MSVGVGLFLGLACLSVVFLYAQTKDRWRWPKITRWAGLLVSIPVEGSPAAASPAPPA